MNASFLWHVLVGFPYFANFFPLGTLPREHPAPAQSDTIMIGINPFQRRFPSFVGMENRDVFYLNPERTSVHLPDRIKIVDIYPSLSIRKEESKESYDRYLLWQSWHRYLADVPPVSYREYKSLERNTAHAIHRIIKRRHRSCIIIPVFWLFPDSVWKYLRTEDRDNIRVYSPMMEESVRFPFGDYTYIENADMHQGDI